MIDDADIKRLRDRARAQRELPSPRNARAIRLASGVSIAELAGIVGVTPRAVVHWEAGARRPRGAGAERYAEALAVLARELGTSP
jgi:DNA-binding transcriptional regulator YiaG